MMFVLQTFQALHSELENQEGVTLMPILLKPKSRGTVRLNSSNIMVPPDINPNYLEYPDDVKVLVDGMFKYILYNGHKEFF